jgi:hypothetical protein
MIKTVARTKGYYRKSFQKEIKEDAGLKKGMRKAKQII